MLIQPELSGLCELDLGSNSLSAVSLLKIRELLMVGRGIRALLMVGGGAEGGGRVEDPPEVAQLPLG